MNYHNILHDDMRNGEGLRVTLFVSGCDHCCNECQNPQTWDINSGIKFDDDAKKEIFDQLDKDYIDGITLSGGDPLNENNLLDITNLLVEIKHKYPNKTIWIYTGYKMEEIKEARKGIISMADVLVDGKFIKELADVNYKWAGSTNQRIWRNNNGTWYIDK